MTQVESVPAPVPTPERVPLRNWIAMVAVALGTFLVVTVENLPMGLLTAIGGGLHVSDGEVGLMVTVSGLVAAVTAPLLPVAIRGLDRRVVLLGLILLAMAANVVSALTPGYAVLMVARLFVGVSIGGFWSLAAGLGVRLVPPSHVARATSLIFFGAMAANVLGVPAGTVLGEFAGWRLAFAAVAAIALLLVAALSVLLPRMPATEPVRLRTLADQLRTPAVRVGVVATFLLVAGHYGAFTFVSPVLQDVSGVDATFVGPLLLAYGVAGMAGNLVAGSWAGRDVRATIVAVSLTLAAVLALFPFLGGSPVTGSILLILWGLAFGGLPVSVQTWIIKAAPQGVEAATGLNTCMFNLAIALGALFGSLIVGTVTVTGVLWAAAGLVVLTSVVVSAARRV
ncbi:MFS transporter [Microbispora corallina]|uniref:MFS transporter n=1 Tax=Microbispora corallina TaxID=83302 RepID=A0ABQ4G151_9ACTN|nr:MFS transporter [Microbispora corallina]GIH40698.1 MFS transporter [Microbispora corallina]